MYIRMHMYTCTYIHSCLPTYIPICIYSWMSAYICMQAYIHVYINTDLWEFDYRLYPYLHITYRQTNIHEYIDSCIYIYTYICTYIDSCMHTFIYACMDTYLQTCTHIYRLMHECLHTVIKYIKVNVVHLYSTARSTPGCPYLQNALQLPPQQAIHQTLV